MSQIRFQIGTPPAGSAARSSEEAHSSGEDGGWTRAKQVALSGSAARASEERKRAEGVGAKAGKTIALRASDGAVVDRDTMLKHSGIPAGTPIPETSSREMALEAADFPAEGRISHPRSVSADAVQASAASGKPEHALQDTPVQPGLLQSAAARIQSLTRSIFQRGDANG